MKKSNILVLVNKAKDNDLIFTKQVTNFLIEKNCCVYIEKEYLSQVPQTSEYEKKQVNIDFALILGGDGTLLNFAHIYCNVDFPFFGINLGRVGCLCEATTEDWKEKIEDILKGNFFIEERNTIECCITRNNLKIMKDLAFNEVSVQRGKLFKMLLINMLVNNSNKTSFYADGVAVSTSTGSSGFSLSCGGPLLLPTARNYVITPINPQLRTITSLVVNDTDAITIDLSEEKIREVYDKEKPIVVIDGYNMIEIERNDRIELYRSEKKLKIVKVDGQASLFEPTFKVAMSSRSMNKK